jgi:flagellar biosynthesis/type III secretory pathway M-ring protein FliF/YscJ
MFNLEEYREKKRKEQKEWDEIVRKCEEKERWNSETVTNEELNKKIEEILKEIKEIKRRLERDNE